MSQQSLGLCNDCRQRVPAEYQIRDGQVWIEKSCPDCGSNESLVSSDATAWQSKRELWQGLPQNQKPTGCTLHCDRCSDKHRPAILFIDITNHCNMDCPICGFSLHGMGFEFNPPMEYFDKVFAAVAQMHPRPVVNLFGGEPTVRDDMFDIIELGRKYGLDIQITTNGLRLADEEYCRKLCEINVGLRLSFDGRDPSIYQRLRNNGRVYDLKLKALENLKKYSLRKHTIIACAALGINDRHIADLIQFCHENRSLIADLGIIPLYESWEPGVFEVAQRTTAEDVEHMVQAGVPGGGVEFIPAGMTHWLKVMRPFFRDKPLAGVLLFAGVHPNCEQVTFLIPDEEGYRGLNHYIKKPLKVAAKDLADRVEKIQPRLARLDPKKPLQRQWGKLLCLTAVLPWLLGTLDMHRIFGKHVLLGMLQTAWRLIQRRRTKRRTGRPSPVTHLRVAVLPFEEQHSLDSERLKTCSAGMPYEEVETGQIKTIPHCVWFPYRNAILRKISEKYGTVSTKKATRSLPIAA
jgi:uncharacterized Fe-S cluster-containing radical SAM superfamily protein